MSKSDSTQLKTAIATATRAVEYARRVANSDETKLEMFINHLHTLSELRVQEGEFMRAESLLREASFRIEEGHLHHRIKPNPLLSANVASSMGFLYDRWGKIDKAREFYEKSLHLAEVGGFLESELGASVSNNLGMIEKKANNLPAAELHYRNALRFFQRVTDKDGSEAAAVLNNLGVLLYSMKRQEEALEAHTQALAMRQKLAEAAPDSPASDDLRQTWQNLAAVHKARGDHESAAKLLRQAGMIQSPLETSSSNWVVNHFREQDGKLPGPLSTTAAAQQQQRRDAAATAGKNPGNAGFEVEVFDTE